MKDLSLAQSWKSTVCITEHVEYSSALTAKTAVTRHPNASNFSLVVTTQVPTSQKNVKANLQLSVLRAAVTMKLTIENAMKGKKRLFVSQQLAYQLQIDIPSYPPPPPPPRHPILLLGNNHSPPNKQYKCRQKATPQVYPKQECFAVLLGPNKSKHNPFNFRASSRR